MAYGCPSARVRSLGWCTCCHSTLRNPGELLHEVHGIGCLGDFATEPQIKQGRGRSPRHAPCLDAAAHISVTHVVVNAMLHCVSFTCGQLVRCCLQSAERGKGRYQADAQHTLQVFRATLQTATVGAMTSCVFYAVIGQATSTEQLVIRCCCCPALGLDTVNFWQQD